MIRSANNSACGSQAADKVPPHDEEAEDGALGCILLAESSALSILGQLTPDYFYSPSNRQVLEALRCLASDSKPLNVVEVRQWLKARGRLDDAGGDLRVSGLPDQTPSTLNFPSFLDILKDLALRRAVLHDGVELERLARDRTVSPMALAEASARIASIYSAPERNGELTVRSPDDLLAMEFPVTDCVLGDWMLAKDGCLVIAGPGGVGKSRLMLQWAVASINGRPFIGLETRGADLRWLILQAENSNRRLKMDFAALRAWCDPNDWPRVNSQLVIHTLESDADGYLALDDIRALRKISKLIADCKPDVVAFDALYNFGIGDLNTDADMRQTLTAIERIVRTGNPNRMAVVLHHALTGKAGAARARGYDQSSYGRNSKVLHQWARGQINIAPGSAEANDVLVVSCGKCSDGKEFPALAIRLNADLIYEPDAAFDLIAWQGEVSGRRSHPKVTAEIVRGCCKGQMNKKQLVQAIRDITGCGSTAAYEWVDRATKCGKLCLKDGKYVAS